MQLLLLRALARTILPHKLRVPEEPLLCSLLVQANSYTKRENCMVPVSDFLYYMKIIINYELHYINLEVWKGCMIVIINCLSNFESLPYHPHLQLQDYLRPSSLTYNNNKSTSSYVTDPEKRGKKYFTITMCTTFSIHMFYNHPMALKKHR